MEYTEEISEAVKRCSDYLDNPTEVATFLDALSEELYDNETLTMIANALRDVHDGVL